MKDSNPQKEDEFIKVETVKTPSVPAKIPNLDSLCPRCHTEVRPTDYYCFNCGFNLQPSPPRVDTSAQIILYTKSILVPPFGVFWAMKYVKQPDNKSKIIGITAVILTVISFAISVKLFTDFMNQVNMQVSDSLNSFYGF